MDVENFDFESRISPEVRAVLDAANSATYDHLWELIRAWYDTAERTNNETLGQCAYELSALVGPTYANPA